MERQKKMKDVAADVAKDWLTLALAGLGITFAPAHEYFGGLFLGLAGASLAARLRPEKEPLELWAVMLMGFLGSHAAALATNLWLTAWTVQLPMLAGGFASRFATGFALRAMGLIEGKADRIVDGTLDRILPDKESDKK